MNKLAFRKAVIFWSIALACVLISLAFFHVCGSNDDVDKFRKILATQPQKIRQSQLKKEREITKQMRSNVAKKLWISDGSLRKMLSITGIRSEIAVYSDKKNPRIVETFYDVAGSIQEQLLYRLSDGKEILPSELSTLPLNTSYEPIQRFRYFEADTAVYDFSLKTLVATNTHFWTYTASGHELLENFDGLEYDSEGFASRMKVFSGDLQEGQFFAEDLKLEIKGGKGIW